MTVKNVLEKVLSTFPQENKMGYFYNYFFNCPTGVDEIPDQTETIVQDKFLKVALSQYLHFHTYCSILTSICVF